MLTYINPGVYYQQSYANKVRHDIILDINLRVF